MSAARTLRFTGLALAALLAASCGSDDSNDAPDDGGDGGGNGGGTENTVTVSNNTFSPASLTVAAGTTVTWSWTSSASNHNVVGDDSENPPSSGSPTDGPHTYQFAFGQPGTFRYHCTVHGGPGGSGMSGTIIVQ